MRKNCVLTLLLVVLSAASMNAQVNINEPWTWVKGQKTIPLYPIYGTQNTPAAANTPGGRKNAVSWLDATGKTWVFGGYGYALNSPGFLNDLWRYDPITNQWTWINGSSVANSYGVYGTKGVAASTNQPGARRGSAGWIDASGNLCMYGGEGYSSSASGRLSDIWKYNTTTNEWTWVNGDDAVNVLASFGTIGIAAISNKPGARNGGTIWVDNSSNVWLFGGDGYASTSTLGRLSDVWKYDLSTDMWTWVNGGNDINIAPFYGPMGLANSAFSPGGRNNSNSSWKDNSGNFWLFGGVAGTNINAPANMGNYLNDLWKYNPLTNQWTWVKGDNTPSQNSVFGTIGVADAANKPGARARSFTWKDADGNFFLLGGYKYGTGFLNDLWKYNISTNQWTWVKGDTNGDKPGLFGVIGTATDDNKQGGREAGTCWVDNFGKLWSFGGDYNPLPTTFTYYNDLWKYDPLTNQTVWLKGDSASTILPVYGTQGIGDNANRPGERRGSAGWVDNSANLWMFGGDVAPTIDGGDGTGYRNDLWKFSIASNQWTWVKGDKTIYGAGVYGTLGLPHPNNKPDCRQFSTSWTDASGNLWMFGGQTFGAFQHNDLWKFDVGLGQWAWINGDNTNNKTGVYGSQGVAAVTNKPGGRSGLSSWKDNSGKIWIFGGYGFSTSQQGKMNDLWLYNPTTNIWTWMNGNSILVDQSGIYGVKGTANAANTPGSRRYAATWVDVAGNLWLFGGEGNGVSGAGYLNDLWKYDMSVDQWIWMNGDNTTGNNGAYGIQGVADVNNKPGSRERPLAWVDATGNFWMMGGRGFAGTGGLGDLNDLWQYNPSTNQWTWVKGDVFANSNGVYAIQGAANVNNKPGARYGATGFQDAVGNFWLYGGVGYAENGESRLDDLWKITAPNTSPLPVRLLEFKGQLQSDNALLNWKTENEENAASFIVERSTDGKKYFPVGSVAVANASGTHQYNFTDPGVTSLGAAVIYYRLNQKDIDAKSKYSSIIALSIDKSSIVLFYPNPVIDHADLTITVARGEKLNARIIDNTGKVVKQFQWQLTTGSTSMPVDVNGLAKGYYHLELIGETITKNIGFVKQ
ncbi:MAG: kelch repeat-containing protein [Chitinophagaceae bacterium]